MVCKKSEERSEERKRDSRYQESLANTPDPVLPGELPKVKMDLAGMCRYAREKGKNIADLPKEEIQMFRDKNLPDVESYMLDGRLTEPSDGVKYDVRKAAERVKELGRPLTEEETESYKLDNEE